MAQQAHEYQRSAASLRRSAAERTRPRFGSGAALALLASIVISFLAASSAPTPLYAVYQQKWGFSPITTTVVFAVYALAVLAALLVLGRVSNHVGRRPVLLAGLAAQAVSMIVFTSAAGVGALLVARVVQGLATGAALGAIGAGMLDIDKRRGAFANAVAPGIGTATGALASALIVRFLPAPTHLVYLVLIAVFALQAVGVLFIAETATRSAGVGSSLVPRLALPRAVRGSVLSVAPVLFAVWALAGFYGSLGPSIIHHLAKSHSIVLGSLGLFVLAGVAAIAGAALYNVGARAVMLTGIAALIVGVAATLVSMELGSTAGFFAGSVVAGIGFGAGFQGGIRSVVPLAAPEERAGLLSVLFVVSYLGMGLPSVAAGFLVVDASGLMTTGREFGIVIIGLALLALPGALRMPAPGAPLAPVTDWPVTSPQALVACSAAVAESA